MKKTIMTIAVAASLFEAEAGDVRDTVPGNAAGVVQSVPMGATAEGKYLPEPQRQWTLEECVNFALEHNISLKQREVAVDNEAISLQTAQFSRLPSLSANLGENVNFGRSQNREGVYEDHSAAVTSIGANASVTVFQGFRINNQIKAGKLSLEAATQELEQARQDLSLQVTAAYLQALYALEEKEIAGQLRETSALLVEHTSRQVAAGRKSESELYDAQSSLADAESRMVEAENSVATALLDLAQRINYTAYDSFRVSLPDVEAMMDREVLLLAPPDSIFRTYLERRPAILAAQKRVELAKTNVKIAQSAFWPSINFGVSYGSGYYSDQAAAGGNGTFWSQLGRNGTTALGVSLNIPIFNRMSTHNGVRQARGQATIQQLALEQARLDAYKEVQQAYVNAKAAYSRYLAGEKSVEAARKAFEYESRKFEEGRSTAYQFNEVRQKLSSASAALAQAKYNFLLRAKILDFYKGNGLF